MLAFMGAAPLAAQESAPDVADKIIAVVGDSIILKSDIDLMWMQYKQSGQAIPDSTKLYRSMLDNRVNELLIVQAAARDTLIEVSGSANLQPAKALTNRAWTCCSPNSGNSVRIEARRAREVLPFPSMHVSGRDRRG